MSKGNPLMGQMRGKVGDLVFTRNAGEQIARSRNRNPKNPRTTKQMAQRAALATVVEMFTRGKRNLFKFAFENKRKGESDYNAFVRANVANVPVQSRKTIVENGFVFGNFVLSQGSLTSPAFFYDEQHDMGSLAVEGLNGAPDSITVGVLSSAIIKANGLQDGDIVTFVGIDAAGAEVLTTLEEAIEAGALTRSVVTPKWTVKQFTLDVNSDASANEIDFIDLGSSAQVRKFVQLKNIKSSVSGWGDGAIDMLGCIVSRNTPMGLRVCSASLQMSYTLTQAAEVGMSDEWKKWVARHWNDSNVLDADPENILEGSISAN